MEKKEYLTVGQSLRPQGLRGEMKIRVLTDDPRRFLSLKKVFLRRGEDYIPVNVVSARIQNNAVYMMLEGVYSREAAEIWRDQFLYVDRENAVKLPENSWFIEDLLGCTVMDTVGKRIGKLTEVMQSPANDVYCVASPEGEILIPAVPQLITQVDTDEKLIIVDAEKMQEMAVYPNAPRDSHK